MLLKAAAGGMDNASPTYQMPIPLVVAKTYEGQRVSQAWWHPATQTKKDLKSLHNQPRTEIHPTTMSLGYKPQCLLIAVWDVASTPESEIQATENTGRCASFFYEVIIEK